MCKLFPNSHWSNMSQRIVITGVGLTAPNADNIKDYRQALLNKKSGLSIQNVRYMGNKVAGLCNFDELKYQKKKALRRGTRAGSIAIYCANEALVDSGLNWDTINKDRVGVFIGITEHGNVETENEIF